MALISIGAAANDGTGDPLRTAFQKVNRLPIWNAILNADSGDYTGTTEQKITACVADAVIQGKAAIWIPKSLQPFSGALVTSNAAVLQLREGGPLDGSMDLTAYGVTEDGVTDVGARIQAVEALRPAWRRLTATPGVTYVVNSAGNAAGCLKILSAGTWDFSGATLKYGGAGNLGNGADGGSLGIICPVANDARFYGIIDCQSKAKYAFALLNTLVRFQVNVKVLNTLETGGYWSGIHHAASADITGIALTGQRASGISGFLERPNCPIADSSGAISGHGNTTALLIGDDTQSGNATGLGLVMNNGTAPTLCLQHLDTIGINQFVFWGIANVQLGDHICHDSNFNVCEIYGTSQANSNSVFVPQNKRVGIISKGRVASGVVTGGGWYYDDPLLGVGPNVWIDGGATVGAGLIDLNPIKNDGTVSATQGGRLVQRLQTPTEAVLVSGVDAAQGNLAAVTLTANRVVGAPLNPRVGQHLTYRLIQDATGGRTITWNAVFKHRWLDQGNYPTRQSSITFRYDGTSWQQEGEQAAYTGTRRDELLRTGFKIITESVPKQALANSITTVTQQLTGMAVGLCAGEVVTGIALELTNTPTSLTLAKVGLYDFAGNRLAASNSDHAVWTGATHRDIPFTAPFTITADALYYLCFLVVCTGTVPTLLRTSVLSFSARNATNGGAFPAVQNTGNADLPTGPVTWSATDGGIWLAAY